MIIPVEELLKVLDTYKINIKGVIHIGAHLCEEKEFYNNILKVDDTNIIWVDAIEEITKINKERGIPNCYTAVLDEVEREAVFKITRRNDENSLNCMSSSLLDFGTHATDHPNVVVAGTRNVRTETLQQFVDKNNIHISKFNFWNLDIQGSELHVLRSSKNLLKYADCIYTEVNTKEVYKGCGRVEELDRLLLEEGFIRVYTHVYESFGWGDAVYVRNNFST